MTAVATICVGCGSITSNPKRGRCSECWQQWSRRDGTRRNARTVAYLWSSPEWNKARASTKKRDGHRCRNCGTSADLTVHHIRPVQKGGHPLEQNNLITLCRPCHGAEDGGYAHANPAAGQALLHPLTVEIIQGEVVRRAKRGHTRAANKQKRTDLVRQRDEARQQQQDRARSAANMRATGTKWKDIAEALGYSGPGAAYTAAATQGVAGRQTIRTRDRNLEQIRQLGELGYGPKKLSRALRITEGQARHLLHTARHPRGVFPGA